MGWEGQDRRGIDSLHTSRTIRNGDVVGMRDWLRFCCVLVRVVTLGGVFKEIRNI